MSDGVSVRGVGLSYGRARALEDVSVEFPVGITGLLGPNGAGKTSLLDVVGTRRRANAGSVSVAGHDVSGAEGLRAARTLLGYLPQTFDLMNGRGLRENVMYAAWANGVAPADCDAAVEEALEQVGLQDRSADKVRSLSGGMRQRAGIACAIAHRPRVLLLDEPTVGLDPEQRSSLRRYLRQIGTQRCVVLSTHLTEDLSRLAQRVVVLDQGRVRFDGLLSDLTARVSQDDPLLEEMSPLEAAYRMIVSRQL